MLAAIPTILQLFAGEYTERERTKHLYEHSDRRLSHFTHGGDNAVYCMDNEQFETSKLGKYFKIGATNTIERRKTDSQTHSPCPNMYVWYVELINFNCFIFEDILKQVLKKRRILNNGGEEFYDFCEFEIVEAILIEYNITYKFHLGDTLGVRAQHHTRVEDCGEIINRQIEKTTEEIEELEDLIEVKKMRGKPFEEKQRELEEKKEMLRGLEDSGSGNTDEFMDKKISGITTEIMRDKFKNSPLVSWVFSRIVKAVHKCIVLGYIQSGKTRAIIELIHFAISYLGISVVVMIQNKTSGYVQLRERISNFESLLNGKMIPVKYAKGIKKIHEQFEIEEGRNKPGVIISLYNTKQLKRLGDAIEDAKKKGKLAPYILITDEYDSTILSRQDEPDEEMKRTQAVAEVIRKNSKIEIGFTATLLGPMVSDDTTEVSNLFVMKPGENYVGFDSDRIKLVDLQKEDLVDKLNGNSIVSFASLKKIFGMINDSIRDMGRDYSITLINTTTKNNKQEEYYENLKGEFRDWSYIKLNSQEGEEIEVSLPSKDSKVHIKPGKNEIILNGKEKEYEVVESKSHISQSELVNGGVMNAVNGYVDCTYKIRFKATEFGLSEIISVCMEYSDKVAVISGFMASRGLSFVNHDFTRHITEMIYLPSDKTHLTKNVQDMRIFGNFVEDCIPITVYTTEEIWLKAVGDYIGEQEIIVEEAKRAKPNTTFKELVNSHEFKSKPRRKIDRPDVVNGIDFTDTNRRGFPLNDTDFTRAYNTVKDEFPGREIRVYSKFCQLEIEDRFQSPLKEKKGKNESSKLSSKYKNLFVESLQEIKEAVESDILFEAEPRVWFIYRNFVNDWTFWNPRFIEKKRVDTNVNKYEKPPNISYFANDGDNHINLVVRLCETTDIKEGDVIMYYGRNGYYYFDTTLFEKSYFLKDTRTY